MAERCLAGSRRFLSDAAQGGEMVVDESGFVFAQLHLVNVVVEFLTGFLCLGSTCIPVAVRS